MKRIYKGYVIEKFLTGWFVSKDGVRVASWLPTLKSAKNCCN